MVKSKISILNISRERKHRMKKVSSENEKEEKWESREIFYKNK